MGDRDMKYVQLTKRTNDPKLSALEILLDKAGINHKREGESFHAPILLVDALKEDEAWEILDPIDDIPDDDVQWYYMTSDYQGATDLDDEEGIDYFNRYIAGDRQ